MDRAYLEIFFLCGMIFQVILMFPYLQNYLKKKYRKYFNKRERLFMIFIAIGYLFLPIIYVFSTWFSWFDFNLPKFLSFLAILLYCFGFWLFFRSYSEMGTSWSPGSEIKAGGHLLITTGLFKWVRHPMYASVGATAIAQLFMLQNWLVGPAFLILTVPFYLYRVKREERELIIHFGDEYLEYKRQTNALFPKWSLIDYSQIISRMKMFIFRKGRV